MFYYVIYFGVEIKTQMVMVIGCVVRICSTCVMCSTRDVVPFRYFTRTALSIDASMGKTIFFPLQLKPISITQLKLHVDWFMYTVRLCCNFTVTYCK